MKSMIEQPQLIEDRVALRFCPGLTDDDGLSSVPIFVENINAVFGGDKWHEAFPVCYPAFKKVGLSPSHYLVSPAVYPSDKIGMRHEALFYATPFLQKAISVHQSSDISLPNVPDRI